MDFQLNEEQISIRDLAQSFARNHLTPYASVWDAEEIFPIECLRSAADLGFAGIYVSEKYGGSGLSRLESTIIFEELSTACPSTAAYLSIHNMVTWMVDAYGNTQLRENFLPRLTSMDAMSSYCLTEPGSGSDAASLITSARKDGSNHYILNGTKAFISGGSTSDLYAVMCRTGEDGPHGISCLLVEAGTPGLSFGKREKKLGWNSQHTTMVYFQDCRVSIDNVVGEPGDGFKIAMAGLDGGRINIGACSIGGARAAMEAACDYARERKQFGKSISQFQSTEFKLADMATEIEAARLMVYRAAQSLDMGEASARTYCAMAKRMATDIGFSACNEALQIHGGYGYLQDFPIERLLRDLRVHQILEGTNEIMRVIIARDLLNK